jgi:dTDP-glucose 4,6-dehydratase
MKTKVLLTGIGGSISAHFLKYILTNSDWDVIGIDSFRHKGWSDRVNMVIGENEEWRKRLTIITHDLTAPLSPVAKSKIGYVDYIISMAALSDVEASIQNPEYYIKNNVDLVINLLEYAREIKPKVFVQISTDEVYGAVSSKHDDLRREWDAIIPSNPYAASKACQEAIAISYWRTYGVPVIITNTMNNFGEMQQSSKFPAMLQKWIAAGKKVTIHGKPGEIGSRSYIHSWNFASAIMFILEKLPPHMHVPNAVDKPDRYNIAGDKQLDNLELAELISSLMGETKLDYELVDTHSQRPGHDPHYGLDSSKLYALGWKPPLTFEESLKNTIEWQSKHPEWMA